MIGRVSPSECKITESYKYQFDIGVRQRVEYREAGGELSLKYPLDAKLSPDLVPRKDAQSSDSIDVGFIAFETDSQARQIRLPKRELRNALSRVDASTKTYRFSMEEPASVPLRVEASIVDESGGVGLSSRFFETSDGLQGLYMKIRLSVTIPLEKLRTPASLHRHLQQILSGETDIAFVRMAPDRHRDQEELGHSLCALANSGGGIITFGVSERSEIVGIDEGDIAEISTVAEYAALDIDPPLAIATPKHFVVEDKHLLIIEVPSALVRPVVTVNAYFLHNGTVLRIGESGGIVASPSGQKSAPDKPAYDTRHGSDSVAEVTATEAEQEIKRGPTRSVVFMGSDVADLADLQAALANAGGGHIYFGVQSEGRGRAGHIIGLPKAGEQMAERIEKASHPFVRRQRAYAVQLADKTVFVQDILLRAPDLYRASAGFVALDGEKVNELPHRDAIELLRNRKGEVDSALPRPEPVLRRMSIKWIDFPGDVEHYDPESRCLVWRDMPFHAGHDRTGVFVCDLLARITRAKEVFDSRRIEGDLEVVIDDLLMQPFSIRSYDALGNRSVLEWRSQTLLQASLGISLHAILQKRTYHPQRSITIYGVEPRSERAMEIVRILNDSGVIVQGVDSAWLRYASLEYGIDLHGEKQTPQGALLVRCLVTGVPSTVRRRSRRGQQIDDKQVPSGAITVAFQAVTEGSHEDITALFNEVVLRIHNRFSNIRVE